jgi:hypothetical protein
LADAFPISGSIDPKAFPHLLMDLHRHGATGSLKVEGPSYQKALYFRSGRILFGSSNDPRDQLGAILIETGKITPEQLEDVQAKVGPGNPLAKALADTGYVSQRELSDAARAKVESILSDVLSYTGGNFEFEDGVLPKGAIDLKLSTERLVLASVRRLTDRNFVLRHLDGLEVVLAPAGDLASRLPDLQPDAGGLPEQLDGKRSLKEAAAQSRLDEFESAKVACALLFLGLVQRVQPAPGMVAEEAPVRLADDPLFNMAEPTGPELDLGDTARASIDVPAPAVPATSAPEPQPEPPPLPPPLPPRLPVAMAAAAAPDPREAEPEPFFIPEGIAPTVIMPPQAPAPAAAARIEAESLDAEPEPVLAAPPTIISPPAPSFSFENEAETEVPPAAPARPSKEDQAALDALLNAPPLHAAPAAAERRPGRADVRAPQPAPRTAGRRSARPPGGLLVGGALLLLAAVGVGAAWYVWGRTPAGAETKRAVAPPSTVAGAVTAAIPAPTPPAALDSTLPAPPATAGAATPSRTGPPNLAEARTLLANGALEQAAAGFAATVRAAPPASASVQILVACSPETVQKAVQVAGSPELFIVPVNYKGRGCYRLCWGLYESASRAESAVPSLPEYFRREARPRVVAASEIVR